MLTKDDEEHPVPEPWRSTFRQIAGAFVAGDFQLREHRVEGVGPIDKDTARRIAEAVAAYGAPLAPLDETTWERSIYRWIDGYWLILVDLSTESEPVSDLTLHANLWEAESRLEIDSVYVP